VVNPTRELATMHMHNYWSIGAGRIGLGHFCYFPSTDALALPGAPLSATDERGRKARREFRRQRARADVPGPRAPPQGNDRDPLKPAHLEAKA